MKALIALFFMFPSSALFAQSCDGAARARAAAILELQSSDQFIPENGVPPRIQLVIFYGVTGPSTPNEKHVLVDFVSKDQNHGEGRRADYIVTVNPETCAVENIKLLAIR